MFEWLKDIWYGRDDLDRLVAKLTYLTKHDKIEWKLESSDKGVSIYSYKNFNIFKSNGFLTLTTKSPEGCPAELLCSSPLDYSWDDYLHGTLQFYNVFYDYLLRKESATTNEKYNKSRQKALIAAQNCIKELEKDV